MKSKSKSTIRHDGHFNSKLSLVTTPNKFSPMCIYKNYCLKRNVSKKCIVFLVICKNKGGGIEIKVGREKKHKNYKEFERYLNFYINDLGKYLLKIAFPNKNK